MAICVYCQQDRKLTREHVFSGVLLREFDDVAPMTYDRVRGKSYPSDPVIKDLCGDCNSHLSPCDVAIGEFAKSHLKRPVIRNQTPAVQVPLLKLWVTKTCANSSRISSASRTWWHSYTGYFRGLADAPNCDVVFANWRDFSPFEVASELNIAMSIDAQESRFYGLAAGSSGFLRQQMEHSEAIKVGYGVFLMIAWKANASPAVRASVLNELRSYGWLGLGDPFWLARVAFNITSCANFNLVGNPDRVLTELLHTDETRID